MRCNPSLPPIYGLCRTQCECLLVNPFGIPEKYVSAAIYTILRINCPEMSLKYIRASSFSKMSWLNLLATKILLRMRFQDLGNQRNKTSSCLLCVSCALAQNWGWIGTSWSAPVIKIKSVFSCTKESHPDVTENARVQWHRAASY